MNNAAPDKAQKILIVTGLSGAGISSALKHLQDLGYETFDNFPLTLTGALISDSPHNRPMAIGIDARSRGFTAQGVIDLCTQSNAELVFLTADDADLHKRFTETRRRHPLAIDRPISEGIKAEQEIMVPLRPVATHIVDTTGLSIHALNRLLEGLFGAGTQGHLSISCLSFGFRYGLPREADIILDVRFLKNPYWEPALRSLTGLDQAVQDYVGSDTDFDSFLSNTKNLLQPLLPRYAAEGKSYLTIAIGCTGGQHRSVHTVESLKDWLTAQGFPLNVVHRDINRQN
ncbi:MAG: RNase adapter RapZ [Micavibrio sp.]